MNKAMLVAVVAVLAATGCAKADDDGAAGAANNFTAAPGTAAGGPQLKDQMVACQAVEKKADDANSTAAMVGAESDIASCYSKAVDAHAAEIDALRKKNGGIQLAPATATAAAVFADYRANHTASAAAPKTLCEIENAASQNFGGTLQSVEDAGCEAAIDIRLAKIVASEADLPGGGTMPLNGPDGTAQQLHAMTPKVVAQMLQNTPEGDQAALTAEVDKTYDGAIAASLELCAFIEDAGVVGGGTGAQQLATACASKAIGMLIAEAQDLVATGDGR